jgi:anti-sigma regulatory factor (Ser/Thr protein kinase)
MTAVAEPLRFSVLANVDALAQVRRTLRTWLDAAGVERADDIVLAVHEAVANAIEHAGLGSQDLVKIAADIVDGRLRVEVRDHGAWRIERLDETRGRGLAIMRAVMDHVDLAVDSDSTAVVMSRSLR